MKKKRVLMLLGSVCLALVLVVPIAAGCAGPTPTPTPTPAKPTPTPAKPTPAEVIRWKTPSETSPAHVQAHGYQWLSDAYAERTDGRLILDIYWGGSLCKQKEGLEALQTGIVDIAPCYPPYFIERFPISQALMLPFAVAQNYQATRMKEELFVKYFKSELDAQGLLLGTPGFTDLYGWQSKEPIRTPDDLKGKKVRCVGGIQAEVVKLLGGSPVYMTTGESYAALQKGVVDVSLLGIASSTSYKYYEVCPYITVLPLFVTDCPMAMRPESYNALPEDIKNIVYQANREGGFEWSYGYWEGSQTGLDVWRKYGCTVIELSDAEINAFADKVTPIWDEYVERNGPLAEELVKDLKALSEKYKDFTPDEILDLQVSDPVQGLYD